MCFKNKDGVILCLLMLRFQTYYFNLDHFFNQVRLHSGAQHGHRLLHNYSEHVRTYAMDVWSGPRCVQIQENIRHAWQWLLEFSREMRRLSLDVLNLQQMCNQLMRLMGDESES